MKKTIPLICFCAVSGITQGQRNTFYENQRAFYECSCPVSIDSGKIDVIPDQIYFSFHRYEIPSNLRSQGFCWTEDNPRGYFVGYLVNTTNFTFEARRQDGSLIMIQEALNEKGIWKPIEYWLYSRCGNSYFNPLVLDPANV